METIQENQTPALLPFLELNEFKFIATLTKRIIQEAPKKNDKRITGIYTGWHNKTPEKLYEDFISEEYKAEKTGNIDSFNTFLIRLNYNYIILDTDEPETYEYLLELLKEKDLISNNSITESFKNKAYKLKYKNHFWFRVDKDEIKKSKFLKVGIDQMTGWDILYGDNGQILEWANSNIEDTLLLTKENFNFIYERMTAKFPPNYNKKVEEAPKITEYLKKPEKIEYIKTEDKPEDNPEDKPEGKHEKEEKEINLLKKILENLKDYRFLNYQEWLIIAMIWINEKYPLEIFDLYSKLRGGDKYDKKKNEEIIKRLKVKNNGYKVATLYMWLKEDNIKVFEELQQEREDFWNMCDEQNELQHSDFSNLYFNLEPNKYIRSPLTGWYEYNEYNKLIYRGGVPSSLLNNITKKLQKYIIEQRNFLLPDHKDYELRNKLVKKYYSKVGNSSFVEGIIKYLVDLYTKEDLDDLINSNMELLAFENKLYDIKERKFRDIEPTDYITKTTKYNTREDYYNDYEKVVSMGYRYGTHPINKVFNIIYSVFENFDMVDYWLLTTALSLFTAKSQSFYILTGKGGNGKGLLNDLIRYSLGEYFYAPENTFLTSKIKGNAPNNTLTELKNVRYVSVSEPETEDGTRKLNADFIKVMSGGGIITTRALFMKKNISYNPQFTVFLQCNEKPDIKYDRAIKRRVKVIKYPFNFVDKPNPEEKSERQKDYDLLDTIKDKDIRDAFITILIKWAEQNINKPFEKLSIPDEVLKETGEYMDDMNQTGDWLNERTEKKPTGKIKTSEAFKDFLDFGGKGTDKQFIEGIKQNGYNVEKSGGYRYIKGVILKEKEYLGLDIDDEGEKVNNE